MSRPRKPPPLPQPGESYQGSFGDERTVTGWARTQNGGTYYAESDAERVTTIVWKGPGDVLFRFVSLPTWRLWQRSARLVEPKS